MRSPALLKLTARAYRDVQQCVLFLSRTGYGDPSTLKHEIAIAWNRICELPEIRPVEAHRRHSGIELRRYNLRQFAIVYAYFRPTAKEPRGVVSIRAVRHWRIRNVFLGVREAGPPPYG